MENNTKNLIKFGAVTAVITCAALAINKKLNPVKVYNATVIEKIIKYIQVDPKSKYEEPAYMLVVKPKTLKRKIELFVSDSIWCNYCIGDTVSIAECGDTIGIGDYTLTSKSNIKKLKNGYKNEYLINKTIKTIGKLQDKIDNLESALKEKLESAEENNTSKDDGPDILENTDSSVDVSQGELKFGDVSSETVGELQEVADDASSEVSTYTESEEVLDADESNDSDAEVTENV